MVIVTSISFGCNKDEGTGTLSVHLTDAPAVYDAVLVDVQGLQIHVSDTEDEGGWQELTLKDEVQGQIDL